MLTPVFKPFVEESPISVMARGMIERVLNPEQLNQWFNETANNQYTKDLLFSSLFDIMSLVVHGRYRSVHAAYQASKEDICVSITSVYNKLNGIEIETSAQLVRYAAGQAAPIIKKLHGTNPDLLPGLRVKLLDGNCIEKSHHRIKELRSLSAGPLPGKPLVVYDPAMRLPINVFPCEDGHSQERSLFRPTFLTLSTPISDCMKNDPANILTSSLMIATVSATNCSNYYDAWPTLQWTPKTASPLFCLDLKDSPPP